MSEYKLNSPPTDCTSAVEFHPLNPELLLATSWDKTVRLYNTDSNALVDSHQRHSGAILAGCFSSSGKQIFSGGLDKKLFLWELGTNAYELGAHDMAVSSLAYSSEHELAVSGSWDKTVRLWDSHSATALVETLSVPERVYSLALSGHTLVAALANRQFALFDMRNRAAPFLQAQTEGQPPLTNAYSSDGTLQAQNIKRSMLKYPTRRVALVPGGTTGLVYSSIEGRVAVEYFNEPAKNYAFKCHRRKVTPSDQADYPELDPLSESNIDLVFPVNALAFHPKHGTFVTGGSDGIVNLWDGNNKKRLKQYGPYTQGISALYFNSSGNKLAIASSYTFDQGDKQ
ncbi:hypothetical protein BB561_003758 [Smittium simulii]|uniref:Anaphase-promoting complex subunit 4 WD40 domain-containing protein n=1 Tax=Smittium simulii TaxID=133385 RepID=A0A2T9YJK2_9FUNG|nr:hypothetical protein BB561_003758 [Smittium simulii]